MSYYWGSDDDVDVFDAFEDDDFVPVVSDPTPVEFDWGLGLGFNILDGGDDDQVSRYAIDEDDFDLGFRHDRNNSYLNEVANPLQESSDDRYDAEEDEEDEEVINDTDDSMIHGVPANFFAIGSRNWFRNLAELSRWVRTIRVGTSEYMISQIDKYRVAPTTDIYYHRTVAKACYDEFIAPDNAVPLVLTPADSARLTEVHAVLSNSERGIHGYMINSLNITQLILRKKTSRETHILRFVHTNRALLKGIRPNPGYVAPFEVSRSGAAVDWVNFRLDEWQLIAVPESLYIEPYIVESTGAAFDDDNTYLWVPLLDVLSSAYTNMHFRSIPATEDSLSHIRRIEHMRWAALSPSTRPIGNQQKLVLDTNQLYRKVTALLVSRLAKLVSLGVDSPSITMYTNYARCLSSKRRMSVLAVFIGLSPGEVSNRLSGLWHSEGAYMSTPGCYYHAGMGALLNAMCHTITLTDVPLDQWLASAAQTGFSYMTDTPYETREAAHVANNIFGVDSTLGGHMRVRTRSKAKISQLFKLAGCSDDERKARFDQPPYTCGLVFNDCILGGRTLEGGSIRRISSLDLKLVARDGQHIRKSDWYAASKIILHWGADILAGVDVSLGNKHVASEKNKLLNDLIIPQIAALKKTAAEKAKRVMDDGGTVEEQREAWETEMADKTVDVSFDLDTVSPPWLSHWNRLVTSTDYLPPLVVGDQPHNTDRPTLINHDKTKTASYDISGGLAEIKKKIMGGSDHNTLNYTAKSSIGYFGDTLKTRITKSGKVVTDTPKISFVARNAIRSYSSLRVHFDALGSAPHWEAYAVGSLERVKTAFRPSDSYFAELTPTSDPLDVDGVAQPSNLLVDEELRQSVMRFLYTHIEFRLAGAQDEATQTAELANFNGLTTLLNLTNITPDEVTVTAASQVVMMLMVNRPKVMEPPKKAATDTRVADKLYAAFKRIAPSDNISSKWDPRFPITISRVREKGRARRYPAKLTLCTAPQPTRPQDLQDLQYLNDIEIHNTISAQNVVLAANLSDVLMVYPLPRNRANLSYFLGTVRDPVTGQYVSAAPSENWLGMFSVGPDITRRKKFALYGKEQFRGRWYGPYQYGQTHLLSEMAHLAIYTNGYGYATSDNIDPNFPGAKLIANKSFSLAEIMTIRRAMITPAISLIPILQSARLLKSTVPTFCGQALVNLYSGLMTCVHTGHPSVMQHLLADLMSALFASHRNSSGSIVDYDVSGVKEDTPVANVVRVYERLGLSPKLAYQHREPSATDEHLLYKPGAMQSPLDIDEYLGRVGLILPFDVDLADLPIFPHEIAADALMSGTEVFRMYLFTTLLDVDAMYQNTVFSFDEPLQQAAAVPMYYVQPDQSQVFDAPVTDEPVLQLPQSFQVPLPSPSPSPSQVVDDPMLPLLPQSFQVPPPSPSPPRRTPWLPPHVLLAMQTKKKRRREEEDLRAEKRQRSNVSPSPSPSPSPSTASHIFRQVPDNTIADYQASSEKH